MLLLLILTLDSPLILWMFTMAKMSLPLQFLHRGKLTPIHGEGKTIHRAATWEHGSKVNENP